VFTHSPPQSVRRKPHEHAPAKQNCPNGQTVAQSPQWFESVSVSMQAPPQSVKTPQSAAHAPARQTGAAASLHAVAQSPQ
jgi:hypothetical protein